MLVRNIFPSHLIYKIGQYNIIIVIIMYGLENEPITEGDKHVFKIL
jgi:hypothetical protein